MSSASSAFFWSGVTRVGRARFFSSADARLAASASMVTRFLAPSSDWSSAGGISRSGRSRFFFAGWARFFGVFRFTGFFVTASSSAPSARDASHV